MESQGFPPQCSVLAKLSCPLVAKLNLYTQLILNALSKHNSGIKLGHNNKPEFLSLGFRFTGLNRL